MIQVDVFVKGDHFFFTFVYAGLERLQRQGLYAIKYIYPWDRDFKSSPSNMILSLQVTTEQEKKRTMCIDMFDCNDRICEEALNEHDLYFKRNYNADKYNAWAKDKKNKIKPFGLVFACKYSKGPRALLNLLSGFSPNKNERIPFKTRIGQWVNYFKFPVLSDYESKFNLPGRNIILFQTRAWNPDNYVNWQEVNESRLNIIRALKRHFRDRFVGGFIPDHFSKQHYPDAITSFRSSRRAYVELLKQSKICIYTHGLFDSNAFKLGEYLACARCIVAQPMVNVLPVPLQDGVNYLSFTSTDECITKCERLLDNHDLANEMVQVNATYYWRHVEPSTQMDRAIKMAVLDHDDFSL